MEIDFRGRRALARRNHSVETDDHQIARRHLGIGHLCRRHDDVAGARAHRHVAGRTLGQADAIHFVDYIEDCESRTFEFD